MDNEICIKDQDGSAFTPTNCKLQTENGNDYSA